MTKTLHQLWTRYFPISVYVRDLISSGKIGTVERTFADTSVGAPPEKSFNPGHRMVNPDLAGGALLDLGIYSLTWIFQTLYTVQGEPKQTPKVISAMRKWTSGVDQMTTMILVFPRKDEGDAHGIATTSLRTSSDPSNGKATIPSIRIQGTEGEIQVFPPSFCPRRSKLILKDGTITEKTWSHPGPGKDSGFKNGYADQQAPDGEGMGMFWEADECAYAIREGRKEGQYESLEESLIIMEVMDEVRKQGGMVLPDKVETTNYPVHGM